MNKGYEDLANAIVIQAFKDYMGVVKRLKKKPFCKKDLQEKKNIEHFFHSDRFCAFTDVGGYDLLLLAQSRI